MSTVQPFDKENIIVCMFALVSFILQMQKSVVCIHTWFAFLNMVFRYKGIFGIVGGFNNRRTLAT